MVKAVSRRWQLNTGDSGAGHCGGPRKCMASQHRHASLRQRPGRIRSMYQRPRAPRSIGGVIDSTFGLWRLTFAAVALYVLIPRLAIGAVNAFQAPGGGGTQ